MVQFGAVFPCYSNKKATEFVLENFRKHFPENPIVLISDGGADFSLLAEKYSCDYHWRENIFGNDSNGYDKNVYDAYRTLEFYRRHKLACDYCKTEYMMLLEDDVYIQRPFTIDEPFALKGVRIGGVMPANLKRDCLEQGGVEVNNYGMCGGSMYNVEIFLSIYDDIIKDIEENQDRLMAEHSYPGGYKGLGVVDISTVYHFGKRGHKYQHAEWLSEVRESNHLSYPVIHQWKQHYS